MLVIWCFLYVWWQNNKQYVPSNILMSKGPFRKRTFAEIEQESVLSNFELKFDFSERLLKNKYEITATKSKAMTNISFGRKK